MAPHRRHRPRCRGAPARRAPSRPGSCDLPHELRAAAHADGECSPPHQSSPLSARRWLTSTMGLSGASGTAELGGTATGISGVLLAMYAERLERPTWPIATSGVASICRAPPPRPPDDAPPRLAS